MQIKPDEEEITRDKAIILWQAERTECEMLRMELRAAQRSIEARDRTIKLLDSEIAAIGAGGVSRLMGETV